MFEKMSDALNILLSHTESHPTLPIPYIVLDRGRLYLQVTSPSEFEAWREALLIPTEDVQIRSSAGLSWLSVIEKDFIPGLSVNLTTHHLHLSPKESTS